MIILRMEHGGFSSPFLVYYFMSFFLNYLPNRVHHLLCVSANAYPLICFPLHGICLGMQVD